MFWVCHTLREYFIQTNFLPTGYRIFVNTLKNGIVIGIYIEGFDSNEVYGIYQVTSNNLVRTLLHGGGIPYVFNEEKSDSLKKEFKVLYDYLLKVNWANSI